jgi:multiple sugar transport system substrate-binding protein
MSKKLVISMFVGLIPFLVFSGGSKETEKAAEKAAKIELEFPSWQAEEAGFADFWKEVIPAFETQNPQYKVKLVQIPFKDYNDMLTTRFAAGNPPTILHLPARNAAQFAAQKWVEPLDDRLKGTDILANWTPLQSSMIYDGKYIGLLLMGYGNLFFYNQKMFEDERIPFPKNERELLEAVKKLTNEAKGVFGIGLTTTDHPNIYPDVTNIVYGLGLSFLKEGRYNFSDPAVVQAVELYRELAKYSPKGTTTELKRQLFVDGKIACMMDGPWVAAMIAKAPESIRPNLKISLLPFPKNPGNPSNSMHIPAAISPEKKEAVWKFITLIASPHFQARYTILTRSPAGRANVLTQEMLKQYPELEVINKAASIAVNSWPENQKVMANYALYSKTVASAMIRLMLTNEPTKKVLEELQSKLEKEIAP